MKYKLWPRFIFRMAAFDWKDFESFLADQDLKTLAQRPEVLEALIQSAPGLTRRWLQGNPAHPRENLKIFQYLVRMCTRATPFRLFAGVGTGTLSRNSRIPKDLRSQQEVLVESVNETRPRGELGLQRLLVNPTLRYGKSAVLFYRMKSGDGALNRVLCRFQIPAAVQTILQSLSRDEFEVKRLRRLLQRRQPDREERILQYIEDLLNQGVLVTSGRGYGNEPFYKKWEPAEDDPRRNRVIYFPQKPELSLGDANMVFAASETLYRLSAHFAKPRPSALSLQQLQSFLEKNSPHAPVPIMNLTRDLVEKSGAQPAPAFDETDSLEIYLARKLSERQGAHSDQEWTLRENDIQELLALVPNRQKAFDEIDAKTLLVNVIPQNDSSPIFEPKMSAHSSASFLLGRFAPFSPDIQEHVFNVNRHEIKASTADIVADIEYTHDEKTVPVLKRRHALEYYIDGFGCRVDGKTRIPLNELAFQLNSKRELELIWQTKNKTVDVHLTCAFNFEVSHHFHIGLLAAFAQRKSPPKQIWTWGRLNEFFHFFPRVSYRGLLFHRRTWILRAGAKADVGDLRRALEELKIPMKVYLCRGDQRLFIDRRLELANRSLESALVSEKAIRLEEHFEGEELDSFEVLISGYRADAQPVRAPRRSRTTRREKSAARERTLPAEGVLYWKLVADPSDFNSILLNIYADASWARNAFFIKYSDPEPHLRIRVIGEKNTARTIVDMNRICRRLRAEGLIHRVDLLTYERELDRYGGEEGCVLFERLSIWESRNLIELWRRQTAQGLGGKSDLLLAIGGEIIGFWLEKAGLSVEERIDFCKKGIYTGAPTSRFPRIEVTEPTIEKAKSFVHVYGENRKSLPKTAAAYLQQKPYLASVIHMSLNRLAFSTGAADSDFYRMALHMIHEKGRHASS